MNNRSIGSLALAAALLGCSGSSDDHPPDPPIPAFRAVWSNVFPQPTSAHLRGVRFINPDQGVIAGLTSNLFRTDNGTAAAPSWWHMEHLPLSRGGDIVALDMQGSELHAVGSDSLGGRRWSTLDANQWVTADVNSTPPAYTAVDIVAPDNVYFLRSNGAVLFMDDGTPVNLSIGVASTWISLDFAGLTGFGYAGSSTGLLYKTVNGGVAWNPMTLPGSVGTPAIRDFSLLLPTLVFACGDGKIIKTLDGGTWLDATGDLPGGQLLRGIHFPQNENVGWVVGNGGAIFKTINGGTNWTLQGGAGVTTMDLYDVWFVDVNTGYAVGDFGTVLRTVDGGTTWVNLNPPKLYTWNAIDFTPDGQRGLAVGNSGRVVRTLDGGATWTELAIGTAVNLHGVSIPSGGTGDVAYVCGASGTVRKTIDLAAATPSWLTPAQALPNVTLRAILFPSNEFMGYVAGDTATLLKTQDGGLGASSWTQQSLPGSLGAVDFRTISASLAGVTLLVGGTDGKLVYTDTAGGLWYTFTIAGMGGVTINSVQTPTSADLFAAASDGTVRRGFVTAGMPPSVLWTSSSPGFAANAIAFTSTSNGWGVNGGIFYTENGGTTVPWTGSADHTTDVLRALWMSPTVPGLGFAAGDNGTIVRTTTGGKGS